MDDIDLDRPEGIIWLWSGLEQVMTLFIATRMARPGLVELFMQSIADRIPIDVKISLIDRLAEILNIKPDEYYPELAADLRAVNEFRVHLAHGVIAPSEDGESLGYWRVKRAVHTFMSTEEAAAKAPKIRERAMKAQTALLSMLAHDLDLGMDVPVGRDRT